MVRIGHSPDEYVDNETVDDMTPEIFKQSKKIE